MKKYHFIGGSLHGRILNEDEAKTLFAVCGNGLSEDMSEARSKGACVHRAELDNELQFRGYLGPMWDGTRNAGADYVLRYETQEVYDKISM